MKKTIIGLGISMILTLQAASGLASQCPEHVTTLDEEFVTKLAVAGDFIYAADSRVGGGLTVFDISDPATPVRRGFYETDGYSMDVTACAGHVCVANGATGLWIFDVSDPSAPALEATHGSGWSSSIAGQGSYVYLPIVSGLQVIDITEPSAPVEVYKDKVPGPR